MDEESFVQFFNDSEIFVTGGSGFLGKGLIEKLLRSFNVKKIYVLLRVKKGVLPNKRLDELKRDQIFDVLRKEKPQELDKLVPIPGDISQVNLDLQPESMDLLQNVSMILHSAATIRFDEPLKTAILTNVRGTREVLKIATNLSKLKIFLYISTLFSNCHLKFIDEKMYPGGMDWRSCIQIAEQLDDDVLRILTKKIIQEYPNTYIFTKSLSENVVNDFRHKMTISLIRPSIVLCALIDPLPGYTDNVSGSTSIALAGGTGILRTLYCDPNMIPNQICLDIVVKTAIISMWKTVCTKNERNPFICNMTGELYPGFTIGEQLEIMTDGWKRFPYNKMLWKPSVHARKSEKIHFIEFIFLQLLPSMFFDLGFRLMGKPPILAKYQRIIFNAISQFDFFLSRPIVTGYSNMEMLVLESKKFPEFEAREMYIMSREEYGEIISMSCRRFLLKEKDSDLPKARKFYKILWWADMFLKLCLLVVFFLIMHRCCYCLT